MDLDRIGQGRRLRKPGLASRSSSTSDPPSVLVSESAGVWAWDSMVGVAACVAWVLRGRRWRWGVVSVSGVGCWCDWCWWLVLVLVLAFRDGVGVGVGVASGLVLVSASGLALG